jgi:hypothetical protein
MKLRIDPAAVLPDDDINSHRNPSTVDKHLEWQAIANVRAWYAEDDRFLHLCHQVAKSVNAMGDEPL